MSEPGALCSNAIFPDVTDALEAQDLFTFLESLMSATTPAMYLKSIIGLLQLQQSKTTLNLMQLNNHQLQDLSEVFNRKSLIYLIRAIFFYKLYPEKLFLQKIHPEKLISVKARLVLLYDFIEMFHLELSSILEQRLLPDLADDLLHNEALPEGIEITSSEEDREAILFAIKSYNFPYCGENEIKEKNLECLNNINRAYKFWFNPDRLIDAVMLLDFHLTDSKQNSCENCAYDFSYNLLKLYQELNTSQCLDLYGYFANNDTCYLMRTLLSLQYNQNVTWVNIQNSDLVAIKRVYTVLDSVMNTLRDELSIRHIKTDNYNRDLPEDIILAPGKRNRDAILRIIKLYDRQDLNINDKIVQIFEAMRLSE